jgi:23S rRNA (adenine2030-N6)-methyltransferase
MLRREDRAVFIERHPEDAALLTERFNQVANLKVLPIDGWTALHALIPPKERRGLVLIDPPYESRDELERLVAELVRAARKWPTGLFLAWYPMKDPAGTDRAAAALSAASSRPVLRLELLIEKPDDPARLNGSGLFAVNAPWTLAAEAELLLPALADRLARSGYGGYRCDRLGPERV